MKPDYAKATAELLEKLRRNAAAVPTCQQGKVQTPNGVSSIIINAPKDCVFYITAPKAPPID